MKYTYLHLILITLSVVACNNENLNPDNGKKDFYITAVPEKIESKAAFDPAGLSVLWSEDDRLSVLVENTRNTAFLSFIKGAGDNIFVAEKDDFMPEAGLNKYYVIYPEIADVTSGNIVVPIATSSLVQNGVSDAGHIDTPLFGYAETENVSGVNVKLQHLTSIMEVKVKNLFPDENMTVKSVSLQTNVPIGGNYRIKYSGGLNVEFSDSEINELSLTTSDCVIQPNGEGLFYIPCAPFSLGANQELSVTVTTENDSFTQVFKAPETGEKFLSGNLYPMTINIEQPPVASPFDEMTVEIVGNADASFVLSDLDNGAKVFTNREYVFENVPQSLVGYDILSSRASYADAGTVKPMSDGVIYIIADASANSLDEWTVVPDVVMTYNDVNKTQLHVYQKQVQAGEVVAIPSIGGFCGAIPLAKNISYTQDTGGSEIVVDDMSIKVIGNAAATFESKSFANGTQIFTNRDFVLENVPNAFAGFSFLSSIGGSPQDEGKIIPSRDGYIYIMATDTDVKDWEKESIFEFNYSDKGKTKLYIFKRKVTAGQEIPIPVLNFQGASPVAKTITYEKVQ